MFFGDGVKVSSVFFFGMALRCPLCSIFVKSSFLVFFFKALRCPLLLFFDGVKVSPAVFQHQWTP